MSEPLTPQSLLEILRAGQPKDPVNVDTDLVRYALYARKSTTSEDKQTSSIKDQVRDCMERLIVPQELNVVKVYEESFSAKVADMREQFNAMIKEIENGRIDGVISWHPDRLSRNMKEAGTIIDFVDRGLIKDLRFPTFNFENTPAGKMLLGITFVMAKQYSEHLSESVGRGNKRAVEDDAEFIGKFKHGYIVGEDRAFRPDPHNFTKVVHMFKMALDGKSQKDIRLWINEQQYTVQKRPQGEYVAHTWDKDDVSKLLRDSHYAGVHKWGKSLINLVEAYDFEPIISVDDFLKINKINSLDSSKILAINRPRGGEIKADLLRGAVYCGKCKKTLTSMLIPKRDKDTNEVIHARYYYKCETEDCPMRNKSARAKVVIDAAKEFFSTYLFITKENYDTYVENAHTAIDQKNTELRSRIASLTSQLGDKKRHFEQVKKLILNKSELAEFYDLKSLKKEEDDLRNQLAKLTDKRSHSKEAIASYQEYLKLMEATPVILGKIQDMTVMDALLRIFFSNFTITPTQESTFKGSAVAYNLKEPWAGFLKNEKLVHGAGTETLTLDLVLGKDAL